jgi:succinyl-diaminopimelate desuccinylase
VVDRCTAVLDRRFLAEESVDQVRRELLEPLADLARGDPSFRYQTRELMVIEPVWTDPAASSAQAVGRAVHAVLGREPLLIASPGTYDQKHAVRIGGLTDCLAYGPGILEQAHQPDEYCRIEDLMLATKVLALSVIDLLGVF